MHNISYKSICICGGGSLGHAVAAIASHKNMQVNILTGHPQGWTKHITSYDCNGNILSGNLNRISNDAAEVIPESELILLCVPGYLIEQTLKNISPFLSNKQAVGSVVCSNGFFWIAQSVLGDTIPLYGFQRVPFICRVKEYGKSVDIKGYKSLLKIAGLNNPDLNKQALFFTDLFGTTTKTLGHFLEATLSNSNPILHPARIYAMLSRESQTFFDKEFLFYEEWDNFSSEILIACDNELQTILTKLPINKEEIPSILSYYESSDANSLTKKIRSIKAFAGIKMSMTKTEHGFEIDYSNRYFTEDIPYGLLIIKSIGVLTNTPTPMIDKVILWMQEKIGKEYLSNKELKGKDISASGIIQNFKARELKLITAIA